MRFGLVPKKAELARPWAKTKSIGPPTGLEDQVAFVEAQIDDNTQLGRAFRLFVYLEPGDLALLRDGNPIEFAVLANQLVPVSVQMTEWEPLDTTRAVVEQVANERDRQPKLGWTTEHDDHHGVHHLVTLAEKYAHRNDPDNPGYYSRDNLLKAAALMVAAIERLDRGDGGPQ